MKLNRKNLLAHHHASLVVFNKYWVLKGQMSTKWNNILHILSVLMNKKISVFMKCNIPTQGLQG